jgi:hypothetical protein
MVVPSRKDSIMRGMKVAAMAVVTGALIVSGAGTAGTGHKLDLSTGQVDGHTLLGRTPAGVSSLVGRPDFTGGTTRRFAIWGSRNDFSLMVIYRRREGRLRAVSLVFERGPLVDPRLGNILALKSTRFQAVVRDRYGDTFELARPYRCRFHGQCTGTFDAIRGGLHVTFGTTARRGTFITVWLRS